MKYFLTALLIATTIACSAQDRIITVNELPTAAQSFIKTHFSGSKPTLVQRDKESNYHSQNSRDGIWYVQYIGVTAFENCASMKEITLPSKLLYISEQAFTNCSRLRSIVLPNTMEKINAKAFSGCSNLASINFPGSLKHIGNRAFLNCTSLTEAYLPNGMSSIGTSVFKGCTNLLSIHIPESFNFIPDSLCQNCSNLDTVILSNSVFMIYESAFKNCKKLSKITIPASVTKSIEASAFEDCTSLDSVTCLIEEPYAFGKDAFKNISPTCVLTVPYGKRAAYIAAGWTTKVFKGGIVELPAPEGIHAVKVKTADKGAWYDLEGREVLQTEKGRIYIRKGKKVLVR